MKYYVFILIVLLLSSCTIKQEVEIDADKMASDLFVQENFAKTPETCEDCKSFAYQLPDKYSSTYVEVKAKEGQVITAYVAVGKQG